MSAALDFSHIKQEAKKMPSKTAHYLLEPKTLTMIIGLSVIPLTPIVYAYAPTLWNLLNV